MFLRCGLCLPFVFNGSLSSLQLKNYLKKQLSIIRPNRKYSRKIKAQSVVDFIYRVT
ncbi:isopentenyl pyrophosphate isomerase [Streptococcus pneumoniae GA11304]|nr:isopentenyl pyrophosphate isomerase [Streptococcus pneumoniae GA16531]EHD84569.1 isopentenyl pyrophosphate isomerase domain protein [Streptococcus pneumoniae GA11304]EHD88783.1 isopentenyl pyrophosphate isomerase [Streptococcus pneumoniae GA11304]EHD88885.1 isopentenyl pyrophosphate isomerase [Streptococcus pneumoniae GA11304]